MNLSACLEGLLFLRGEEGLSNKELTKILEIDNITLDKLIIELKEELKNLNRGIDLKKYGNIYKLVTKEEYNNIFKKLIDVEREKPLTTSALEVLAIIAYNEPVTRMEIDEIRGMDSSYTVRTLKNKNLITESGRLDMPGKPILYKTTDEFLNVFGLKSKEELPNIEIEKKDQEIELFQ